MKKVLGILSFFLILGFAVCVIAGFCTALPEEVTVYGAKTYKFLTGLGYFLEFLPAMVFTGFAVSCSVHFGHNSEGSTRRFSHAMFKKFEIVMIVSIISVALLTLANETFGLMVTRNKAQIINRPKTIKEYIKVGNYFYDEGFYSRAARYADAVLKLEPDSIEGNELKNKTDIVLKHQMVKTPKINAATAEVIEDKETSLKFEEEKISQAYQCLLKSRKAFEEEKWFDAHYNAEMGIKLTSSKDPNLSELKQLSAKAWNNITQVHKNSKTEAQLDYAEKCEAYMALIQGDDLKAYYLFSRLSNKSLELSRDPDVVFYLDVSKKSVEEKYFFIDETLELASFETANDVYFTYTNPDHTQSIFYFKGMTVVESTGFSVQYLRDFSIITLDGEGRWLKTMKVPYAKILPVATANFDKETKDELGIDEKTDYVPYILLKSIGRNDESLVSAPEYSFAAGVKEVKAESILYPISFELFRMIEESTGKPEGISMGTLFKLVSKASKFGYSSEMYGQNLLNRLLYPVYLLFLLVCMASFGWNNRIGESQYFRFSWVFSFPFMIFGQLLFYQMMMFLFRLLNYVLLGLTGATGAIILGLVIYLIAFVCSSVYFIGRRSV